MPNGKPNILVVWGDDIGLWNLSAYSRGAMGYRTPNIDRIAREGAIFTDHYAQPSCTAGRAAFITGQLPIRTGLTTIGIPGSPLGLRPEDPTLAEVLKPLGYATGQFGKNHLGDRNEHLPTAHGFDEFFGNLYHLNAEEETQDVDYPAEGDWAARLGPRGVLHSWATADDDDTIDPRFGRVGKQRIEDTGPLTPKRMETVDDEFIGAAFTFMEAAKRDEKPFFVWLNTTRMHVFTHVPAEYLEKAKQFTSGFDVHGAGMLQHDEQIGGVLQWLDDNGLADDTILIYSTDNGPEHSTFPHGSTSPYRSEKMTTWEGGIRVPMMVRWPGHIPPGRELNGIHCGEDVFATLAAAAGAGDIKGRLANGGKLGSGSIAYKCHIDGLDQLDYWTGATDQSARDIFFYYAESHLQAMRWNQWKLHFATRNGYYGTTTELEIPWLFNIRQDPFETYDQAPGPRADVSQRKSGLMNIMLSKIHEHLATFEAYPPRQAATTLKIDDMIEKMTRVGGGQ
ncbi:arylsulfatase [Sphingomonas sp. LaA6.9]|uniref:arylsulfatase n=1 Tax=Sphingomonas sp. LaA6.9 TaxID=2919914 RepID=UPI001F500840|nr:arylsulfatase [Sphingomonas sp. LaA6.9]MCJ8159557.1 arylsulfatase [Sphingomonas sp. LaA6.9]